MAGSNVTTLVDYRITEGFRDYLYRTIDLGIMEGRLGEMEFTSEVIPLIEALHHVLAGGAAKVEIAQPGEASLVAELNEKLDRARHQANAVNGAAQVYVTAS
jgi:hypothetical protein